MSKEISLSENLVAIVDDEDHEWLTNYGWRWNGRYVVMRRTRRTIFLHRFIMGEPRGKQVHHKNRNSLDNRRGDLALETGHSHALSHKIADPPSTRNTSGYKGVSFHKQVKKWKAEIKLPDGTKPSLGCYDSAEEAARVYNEAAREIYGEEAYQNPIPADRGGPW